MHHFIAINEFKLKLQSGNAQYGSKSTVLLHCVTLEFDGWPWKTTGHFFYVVSNFVRHFITINEFKLKLQSGNDKIRSKLTSHHWWLLKTLWRYDDRNIVKRVQQTDEQTDGRTDRSIIRAAWSQLKIHSFNKVSLSNNLPLRDAAVISNVYFQAHFMNSYLRRLQQDFCQVKVIIVYWCKSTMI